MALRNLATRMRYPAAAVLRPRVSPPAGTRPLRSRLFSSWEEDRKSVKWMYLENLATLDRVKKHLEFMRVRVGFLEKGNKWLRWSFRLLMPIHAAAVILRVTNSKRRSDHALLCFIYLYGMYYVFMPEVLVWCLRIVWRMLCDVRHLLSWLSTV